MQPDVIQIRVEQIYAQFPILAARLDHSREEETDSYGPLQSGGGSDILTNMEANIAKLEAASGYIQRDVTELRTDVRDARERLAKLEERVSHLPGKGFIVSVVTTALVIAAGIVALAPKLQSLFP